jgi:hypothetical protein
MEFRARAPLLGALLSIAAGPWATAEPTAEQTRYVQALVKKGYLAGAVIEGSQAVVRVGPKFIYISAPPSQLELCHSLLAYYRAQNKAVTEVVLTSQEAALTRCS